MSAPASGRGRGSRIAASLAALAAGAPGCLGLALGRPVADWPVPFHPQLGGEIALKTVVYFSGLLASLGAIGLAWNARGGGEAATLPAPPLSRDAAPAPRAAGDPPPPAASPPGADADRPVSFAEPLYGFLPRSVQEHRARATGYQALLYTKLSILLSTAVGVLLAGSWEAPASSEAIPADTALRIGMGLYLIAESLARYRRFARGEPSGTLAGTLVHGALWPLRGGSGGRG